MSSGAERKSRTRELRRLGYRGQIAFQIHEDGIDQLIALGKLDESEADDLDHVARVVETLINADGIERLITASAQRRLTEIENLPTQTGGPQRAREVPNDVPFIY